MDMMTTIEQYSEMAAAQNEYDSEDNPSLDKWKSVHGTGIDSDDSSSAEFDCNICLDSVHEPVVTLCGHLYCWPCIYKWLHFRRVSTKNEELQQLCPVCKAEVSQDTLVPLFGRGKSTKSSKTKVPNLGIIIPRRPPGLACGFDSPRSPTVTNGPRQNQQIHHARRYAQQWHPNYSPPGGYLHSPMLSPGSIAASMFDPVVGMFGEMIFARLFGGSINDIYAYPNSYHLAGSASPRLRRHVMQADKSLGRICFFLFCCVFLCFLLF